MAGGSNSKSKATKDDVKPNATKDDAYAYLRAVKDTFHNDHDIFDNFIAILVNFKARRYVYM